jgi:hypothetical protein
MNDDPAIKALRDSRHRISASVGHDPRKLVEYYQRLQERHRERLLRRTAEEARSGMCSTDTV